MTRVSPRRNDSTPSWSFCCCSRVYAPLPHETPTSTTQFLTFKSLLFHFLKDLPSEIAGFGPPFPPSAGPSSPILAFFSTPPTRNPHFDDTLPYLQIPSFSVFERPPKRNRWFWPSASPLFGAIFAHLEAIFIDSHCIHCLKDLPSESDLIITAEP